MEKKGLKFRISPLRKALITAAAVIISVLLCKTTLIRTLDSIATDTFFLIRGEKKAPQEAVIVAIDEASFSALGLAWPWPRKIHADLLDSLYRNGATTVAMDVIFGEPSSLEDDKALKESLARHAETILASNIQIINDQGYIQQTLTLPAREVSPENLRTGIANLPVDEDGLIRKLRVSESGIKTVSAEAAEVFLIKKGLKQETVGLIETSEAEINFLGPPRTIKTVSYYQALEPEKYLPKDIFRDKMIFVGLVTGVNTEGRDKGHDSYPVPYTRWKKGYMAGVEIHAAAAVNIVRANWIRPLNETFLISAGILIGIISGFIFLNLSPLGSFLLFVLSMLAGFSGSYFLFIMKQMRIPLSLVLLPQAATYLTSSFIHYVETWKEKRFITSAFTTYLSPGLVQRLLKDPESLKPGGESVEATVMFLDFQDFTSLSEKTPPDVLIGLLNSYLSAFTEIIFKWNGMIDKFIGDAVMAVWGVPLKDEKHALNACMAALEIKRFVEEKTGKDNGLKISIRIGINSGVMTAGNVGGSRHFNYTVLGDSVNIASRLEGINKIYGTTIMAGHETINNAGDSVNSRFMDLVKVKGKEKPIRIYELRDSAQGSSEAMQRSDVLFNIGLEKYSERNWTEAADLFRQAYEINPHDRAALTYSRRCESFLSSPPKDDWDGAVNLEK